MFGGAAWLFSMRVSDTCSGSFIEDIPSQPTSEEKEMDVEDAAEDRMNAAEYARLFVPYGLSILGEKGTKTTKAGGERFPVVCTRREVFWLRYLTASTHAKVQRT